LRHFELICRTSRWFRNGLESEETPCHPLPFSPYNFPGQGRIMPCKARAEIVGYKEKPGTSFLSISPTWSFTLVGKVKGRDVPGHLFFYSGLGNFSVTDITLPE
jgi:hypothetical protein